MSIYFDILSALKTRVESAVSTNATVALRKRPVMLSGDPFPMVVIAPTDDGEIIEQETFQKGVTYIYPVVVVMYLVGDRNQNLAVEGYLSLRQTIRDAIYQPLLSGAGTVYDTVLNMGGSFIQVENRATVELTTFRVNYLSSETRSV